MKKKLSILVSALLLIMSIIPMNLTASAAGNAAPNVVPAIREWKGDNGNFVPNKDTKLVNASSASAVEKVSGFFADMLSLELEATTASSGTNEILFVLDETLLEQVGDEGYTLTATENNIEVKAPTETGLLYGGITIVQSINADGYFPCGTAIDYPAYKVRSGLIDVARLYMPMDELMNITRYMAWFKLNEIHVHINDNGKNGYSAFRLESDIPGLTATDGYYTKEEYRQYQLEAAGYGVTVLTEIDSPHHARCFSTVNIDGWTPKLLTEADGVGSHEANRALDIRDEKTVQLIESIFTEYLGGDNPVILNDTIHIGMDEYPNIFPEESEKYINRIIKHVNSLGYTARFWSSFGENGFLYGASLDEGMDFDTIYWDSTHSGYKETYELDCGIVNYLNNYLYIVPGWNDQSWESFEDFFDVTAMQTLYEKWQVNQWTIWGSASSFNGGDLYASDDEKMLGAAFSVWNDFGSAWFGLTYRDVVDRIRNIAPFVAEKCWCGDDTNKKIKFDDYYSRFQKQCWRAGDVDIFHRDLGDVKLDFSSEALPDYATNNNGKIEDGYFVLNGDSFISMTEDYVGFPNTLSFDLILDSLPAERTNLFHGKDDESNIFIDTDGTIGFSSKLSENDTYNFAFDYKVPVNQKVTLTLTSDMYNTVLMVNGGKPMENTSDHLNLVTSEFAKYRYSTLTIPLTEIGKGINGKIDNIEISLKTFDPSKYVLNSNIAYKSEVISSASDASNAVDGDSNTKLVLPENTEEQKFIIDLGALVQFNKINIEFYRSCSAYEISVSDSQDGEYTVIYTASDKSENTKRTDEIALDKTSTGRYIAFTQKKSVTVGEKLQGCEINEIQVMSPDLDYYNSFAEKVQEYRFTLAQEDNNRNGVIMYQTKLKRALAEETPYLTEITKYVNILDELMVFNGNNVNTSNTPNSGASSAQPVDNSASKKMASVIVCGIIGALVLGVAAYFIKKRRQ